ncbi:MAG: hypothetical protein VXZ82_22560 [Planctomycetota bacterium]|nr:hypothetical protein [Planctomycetota bacterium]
MNAVRQLLVRLLFLTIACSSLTATAESEKDRKKTKSLTSPSKSLVELELASNNNAKASPSKNPSNKKPIARNSTRVNPVAVLKFVSEHLPELRKMIDYLEKNKPEQYEQAIREFSRDQTRLAAIQKRDADMYRIELELWQLEGKLRMLAAEIAALKKEKDQASAEKQLEMLVTKQQRKSLEKVRLQRDRAAVQLARLENLVKQREENAEALTARSLKLWKSRIEKQKPRKASSKSKNIKKTDSK